MPKVVMRWCVTGLRAIPQDIMRLMMLLKASHVFSGHPGSRHRKSRRDGKRPDGLTLIPFQGGKPLVWDVTVTTSLAESYVDTAAIGAEQATNRKLSKYAELASDYILEPIAVKNLGSFHTMASQINIYSQLSISTIRIADINNSNC